MNSHTPPALLCDAMLLGLGKWLRAAGYDTAMPDPRTRDRLLVEQAIDEQRLLITRDRSIGQIRGAGRVLVLLSGNGMQDWVAELAANPGIDWLLDPFSRCLLCNRPLTDGPDGQSIPGWVREKGLPSWHCPVCRRAYWHGGHVERMTARLESFAALAERAGKTTTGSPVRVADSNQKGV